MRFYSTNKLASKVSFHQALFHGLAKDGGLYVPESIPVLPKKFFQNLSLMSLKDIAFEIVSSFVQKDILPAQIKNIIKRALTFDAPLRKLGEHLYVLELFHGPTLAFKDFGARFMAEVMSYYLSKTKKKVTILVATSGDTGSAIASAFYKVPGVKVVILYPKNKVSDVQERHLTTFTHNIRALAVKGSFDDCQRLVKEAFQDNKLRRLHGLNSANSINIARLIPQIFYYFYAYSQLKPSDKPVVISVPCGNFGNLTGGILAKKMGLPLNFVAATNANNVFIKYVKSGVFKPKTSKHTLSNSMDVGNPSNLARVREFYKNDIRKIRKDISGYSFTDKQTLLGIREVYEKYNYIIDPHSAVAYLGLKKYQQLHKRNIEGIFVATAHPAKFPDVIKKAINKKVIIPVNFKRILKKHKKFIVLPASIESLKEYLYSEK